MTQQIYEVDSLWHYQAQLLLSGKTASIVSGTHLRYDLAGNVEQADDGVAFISVDAIYGIN